jgi:hypothetical protein
MVDPEGTDGREAGAQRLGFPVRRGWLAAQASIFCLWAQLPLWTLEWDHRTDYASGMEWM